MAKQAKPTPTPIQHQEYNIDVPGISVPEPSGFEPVPELSLDDLEDGLDDNDDEGTHGDDADQR